MIKFLKKSFSVFIIVAMLILPVSALSKNEANFLPEEIQGLSVTEVNENNFSPIYLGEDFQIDNDNISLESISYTTSQPFDNISIDLIYRIDIQAGYGYYLRYTPTQRGYYSIETFGNTPTALIDNNSGSSTQGNVDNINSQQSFYVTSIAGILEKKQKEFVLVGSAGTTYVHIRMQRFSAFTASDSNGEASALFPPLFWCYNTEEYQSAEFYRDFASFDKTNKRAFSSEVVFFSGHGSGVPGDKGGDMVFDDEWIDTPTIASLYVQGNKFTFWSACYSGEDNNTHNLSAAQASVRSGSLAAFGFVPAVSFKSAIKFQNIFFKEIGRINCTVEFAARSAASSFLFSDAVKDYVIEGDRQLRIGNDLGKAVIKTSEYKLDSRIQNNFVLDTKNYEYKEVQFTKDIKRFYKTIDDIITNDFYDIITDDNGNAVNINKSNINISSVEIKNQNLSIPFKNKSTIPKSFKKDNVNFKNLTATDTTVMYYKNGDVILPIEVNFCTYLSDKNIPRVEVFCYNLLDGSTIDYEDIMLAKQ